MKMNSNYLSKNVALNSKALSNNLKDKSSSKSFSRALLEQAALEMLKNLKLKKVSNQI